MTRRTLATAALTTALAVAAASSCTGADPGTEVTRERVGDTIVVTNAGPADTVSAGAVAGVWQSPDLEGNPSARQLTRAGDTLFIGDRTRFHMVSQRGDFAPRTIGREGEGPDEFRSIWAIAIVGDTVVVEDRGNMRRSFYDRSGALMGSQRIEQVNGFNGSRPVAPWNGGLLRAGIQYTERGVSQLQVALLWQSLAADTAAVLGVWPGAELRQTPGAITNARLFPQGTRVTVASGGRVARGRGHEPCVTVRDLDREGAMRVCRNRDPIPVGDGVRNPDWSAIEDPAMAQVYRRVMGDKEVPEHLPYFDELLLADDGTLWLRTFGPGMADLHPALLDVGAVEAPEHRHWDVFDATGELVHTARLPSAFEPHVVTADSAFGFYELETGEVVVAAVGITGEPVGGERRP